MTRKKKATAGSDRHGLPQLTGADDLLALFGAAKEETPAAAEEPEASFSALFAAGRINAVAPPKSDEPARSAAGRRKAGQPPLATIDLHGLSARQAEARVESFIRTAWARGIDTLRIITGKGLHSPEGQAVIQEVVEETLARLRQTGLVAEGRWEKGARQRSGAVVVRLKRRNGEKK